MPIQSKRELICKNCGKKFTETFGDAIMPADAKLLKHPLCKKCRFIAKIRKK